jgi:hypothetical protein
MEKSERLLEKAANTPTEEKVISPYDKVDFTNSVGYDEVLSPEQADNLDMFREREIQLGRLERPDANYDRNWEEWAEENWEFGWAIGRTNLTGELGAKAYQNLWEGIPDPDPDFNAERLKARLEEAAKTIAPHFLGPLGEANSDAHFDQILKYVQARQEAYQILQDANSAPEWVARGLATILDPATLAIAIPSGGIGALAARAAGAGTVGALAVGGAVGNVAPLVAQEATDWEVESYEYALLAAIGLGFGAAVGKGVPALQNLEMSQMAKNWRAIYGRTVDQLAKRGEKGAAVLRKYGINIPERTPGVTEPKTSAQIEAAVEIWQRVKDYDKTIRAGRIFSIKKGSKLDREMGKQFRSDADIKVMMETDRKWLKENGLLSAKTPDEVRARIPKVIEFDAVPREEAPSPILSAEDDISLTEAKLIPDEGTPVEQAGAEIARQADPLPEPRTIEVEVPVIGPVSVSEDIARVLGLQADEAIETATRASQASLRRLENLEAHVKNPRYVSRVGTDDGGEYVILAQTDDMSGPYRVMKMGKPRNTAVARDLPSLEDAQNAILFNTFKRDNLNLEGVGDEVFHKMKVFKPADEAAEGKLYGSMKAVEGRLRPGMKWEKAAVRLDELEASQAKVDLNKVKAMMAKADDGGDNPKITIIDDTPVLLDGHHRVSAALLRGDEYLAVDILRHADELVPELQPKPQSVGAARVATKPQFLEDAGLRSVGMDDPPRPSVGGWLSFLDATRFDVAGRANRALSPITRMIAPHLMNETVGIPGQRTPFSAIHKQMMLLRKFDAQYRQVAVGAFQEYTERMNASSLDIPKLRYKFNEEVGFYITGRDAQTRTTPYPPEVERAGKAMQKVIDDIRQLLQNPGMDEGKTFRPVNGAENLEENLAYLWRRFDGAKVNAMVDEIGIEPIENLVYKAIQDAQPSLNPRYIEKLSKGYVQNIVRRAVGLGDEWSIALGKNNRQRFHQILINDTNLQPDEIDDLLNTLLPMQNEVSNPRLKSRVFLDESTTISVENRKTGEPMKISFKDLLDNDADALFTGAVRRLTGDIAMAKMQIKHPRTGEMLVPGITSDSEWDRLMQHIREWYADNGNPNRAKKDADRDIERLTFIRDRIVGYPDPKQMTEPAQWLRMVREFQSARLMGMVGFAQLGEQAHPVAHLGYKAAIQHMPGFRRLINAAGESRLINQLSDELEAAAGIGTERLHGLYWNTLDDVGDLPYNVPQAMSERGRYAREALSYANRAIYEVSGMNLIQALQHRQVGAIMAQKLANIGRVIQKKGYKGISSGDKRRLAQLGLGEDELKAVTDQMRQHVKEIDGPLFGKKIQSLNLQNWTDLEAKVRFEEAIFKAANKYIQTQDASSAAFWMSGPVAQTIFQFRSFVFTAYSNQFLSNLHVGDPRTLMAFMSTMIWNAAVRRAQLNIVAAGRSDSKEYLEKYATPWELAKAGFERSGWASILPMAIDTVAGGGVFNARSSGQPTNAIWGNPAMSSFDQLSRGIHGLIGDGQLNQRDARSLIGLLPFQNLHILGTALNSITAGLPE